MRIDRDDNIVVAGYSPEVLGRPNDPWTYVAKYRAADGMRLWEKRVNGTLVSFDLDPSNQAICQTEDASGTLIKDYITKLSGTDGDELWTQTVLTSVPIDYFAPRLSQYPGDGRGR